MALYQELKLIEKVNFINRFFRQFALGLPLCLTLSCFLSLIFWCWLWNIACNHVILEKNYIGKVTGAWTASILYPNSCTYSSSHRNTDRYTNLSGIWSQKKTVWLHSETQTLHNLVSPITGKEEIVCLNLLGIIKTGYSLFLSISGCTSK